MLVRKTEHGAEVVQRFLRQRANSADLVSSKELALSLPGLKTADDADYTLEVGDGSSGGGNFLPSEFKGIGKAKVTAEDAQAASLAGGSVGSKPFAPQLRDILQECHALGYEHPDVAFCIAPPDVSYVELKVPPDEKDKDARLGAGVVTPAEQKRLFTTLPQHYSGPVQEDRVAFLPLATLADKRRFLALVADPNEPVAQTLAVLRDQGTAVAPNVAPARHRAVALHRPPRPLPHPHRRRDGPRSSASAPTTRSSSSTTARGS